MRQYYWQFLGEKPLRYWITLFNHRYLTNARQYDRYPERAEAWDAARNAMSEATWLCMKRKKEMMTGAQAYAVLMHAFASVGYDPTARVRDAIRKATLAKGAALRAKLNSARGAGNCHHPTLTPVRPSRAADPKNYPRVCRRCLTVKPTTEFMAPPTEAQLIAQYSAGRTPEELERMIERLHEGTTDYNRPHQHCTTCREEVAHKRAAHAARTQRRLAKSPKVLIRCDTCEELKERRRFAPTNDPKNYHPTTCTKCRRKQRRKA